MRKIRYYSSFCDDFEESANQNYVLPDGYQWVRTDLISKFLSGLIYGLAVIFGGLYCRCILHMKIRGRKNLKGVKGGFFIYGNHTQPLGDVFIPALCAFPKRIYTVVSTANYGIPIIGKILPFLGALPIADSLNGLRSLNSAIEYRLKKGCPIVIYPEAHVWEYYTKIRPFPNTSFTFPTKLRRPAFAMTVTYRKSKLFKKPIMDVYIDGPFFAEKGEANKLHGEIFSCLQKRSENSNFDYIEYKKK